MTSDSTGRKDWVRCCLPTVPGKTYYVHRPHRLYEHLSLPFLPHPFLSPFATTSLCVFSTTSVCFLPHLSLSVFSTTSVCVFYYISLCFSTTSVCFLPHLSLCVFYHISLFFYHICVFCHISFFVCLILHKGQIWCEITYTIWTQFRFKQSWETMWISFFTLQVFKHFGTLLYRIFFPSFCCELHTHRHLQTNTTLVTGPFAN